MPSALGELFADLSGALDALPVRWYLFGAQAAIFYGAARLTADVDVTVDPGTRPVSELVEALRRRGFAVRVADVDQFVERTRVLPFVHEPSRIPCDVVLAGPGVEELFLDRALKHWVEGVQIPVASAEDLVAMKILGARPKDLEDVVSLVVAQGSGLDLDRIRATLRLLEEALNQGDLLPLLDQTLNKARRPR